MKRRPEPHWLDERDALTLHARLLAEHGGAAGLRDRALLESALARPRQIFTYRTSATLFDLAAAVTAGIVRNHPFVDGNKRTGFVLGILFMEINGSRFHATEEEAANAVMALAAADMTEEEYSALLAASTTTLA